MQCRVKLEFSFVPPQADQPREARSHLVSMLAQRRGVAHASIEQHDGKELLHLHYDPNLVSMAQIRRWARQAGGVIRDRYRFGSWKVVGMDCGDCAASIEHILGRLPGVLAVSVSYAGERMRIEYDATRISQAEIVRRVRWMGYRIDEAVLRSWPMQHVELLLALAAGALLLCGWLADRWWGWPSAVTIPIYVLSYLAGGYHAALHGLPALARWRFDVDLLMLVAALGAATLGKWPEGALLLFLFSLGHALEHFAMDRARHAIEALGAMMPQTAHVRRADEELELPVESLERGDVVVVRPGERIPVDGHVLEGESAVDQSTLTGESIPVAKGPSDTVFAGTLNGEAALIVRVTKLAKDTTLARVVQLVEEAQTQKSQTQRFAEQFERYFVPAILVGVLVAMVLPPVAGWWSWSEAFLRGMTILVAASPCALAIATPAAILAGIAQAARHGVLIKGGVHLEVLGTVTAMAFDKTGTITRGQPEVTDIVAIGVAESELVRLAAAVEKRSTHPLAKAILHEAARRGLAVPEAEQVTSLTGQGIQARVEGRAVRIGSRRLFVELAADHLPTDILSLVHRVEAEGKSAMLVQRDDQFVGVLGLADQPRDNAADTLQALGRLGITHLVMLTGDNQCVAEMTARQVGMTQYQAGLMPEEKLAEVRALIARHGTVAMVGDGVNDAPALTTASVGIAMGASGSDVALETADVALMADDLSRLPFVIALSRQTRWIIGQNLCIALGVIAVLVPFALFGWAGIGAAIVLHEGSTLVVVANALRLLGYRR